MTRREQVLANAERFVRDVVSKDFKQPVAKENVKAIAKRVSRVIPTTTSRQKVAELA